MRKKIYVSTFFAIVMLLLQSCSIDSPLCRDEHPHQALLDVRYVWPAQTAGELRPDSMYLLASRAVYQQKYAYKTTALPSGNTGRLLLGPDEARTTDTGLDSLLLHCGEYNIVTFNGDQEQLENNESFKKFKENPDYPIDDIWLGYEPLKDLSDYRDPVFREWNDHNSYSLYLDGMHSLPIFCGVAKVTIPNTANAKRTKVVCEVVQKQVSQKFSVKFTCEPKEKGIVVDSCICEISGVVDSMQLSTRRLLVDRTYKALFRAEPDYKGADAKSRISVEGSVNVPGVVRNSSPGTVIGPGVLQVALYVHYDIDGKTFKRILQASINLYKHLTDNPSVYKNELGHVLQKTPELKLEISNILHLYYDKIVPGDEFGAEVWHPYETIVPIEPN